MKIVHTADWHWSEHRLDKCRQSAEFILARLEDIRPDLHIIAGDYWDKRQVLARSSAALPAIEAMMRLASISPVIVILGNDAHDAAGSLELFGDLRTVYPVYASERPETIALRLGKDAQPYFERCAPFSDLEKKSGVPQVLVHLLPYFTKSHLLAERSEMSIDASNLYLRESLRKIFLGFAAVGAGHACPHILAGHCSITGALISSGQTLIGQDVEVSKNDLALACADYYALGHIHVNQEIAPGMWYAGSTYHNNFGETERKYFNIVDFAHKRLAVERIEIPSRPLSLHEVRLDSATDTLVDEKGVEDWSGAELRVRVHLKKEQERSVDDGRIRRKFPGAWSYSIERIIAPEERLRSEGIADARSLKEKLREWAFTVERDVPNEVLEIADEAEAAVRSTIQEG